MLNVIAPDRRQAFAWCRQQGHDPKGMRIISRREQMLGLTGEVILVNRGAILGTTEAVLNLAYQMEERGDVTLRIEFTK